MQTSTQTPDRHQVIVYSGSNWRFRRRWFCICGDPLPQVAFGIPLNKAFAEHVQRKEQS